MVVLLIDDQSFEVVKVGKLAISIVTTTTVSWASKVNRSTK